MINLSLTYTPFVSLTGTAPGASRTYDNDDITNSGVPKPVNIGTMGLESNVGGICDLTFTTANTFKLLHTVTNNNLGNYKIHYKGLEFNEINNPLLSLPCTSTATDIDFELNSFGFSNIDPFLDSGTYQDVITVVVTTQ
ncbi:MAG: hypothetical protein V7749_08025 [Cocleimonas sp.]